MDKQMIDRLYGGNREVHLAVCKAAGVPADLNPANRSAESSKDDNDQREVAQAV